MLVRQDLCCWGPFRASPSSRAEPALLEAVFSGGARLRERSLRSRARPALRAQPAFPSRTRLPECDSLFPERSPFSRVQRFLGLSYLPERGPLLRNSSRSERNPLPEHVPNSRARPAFSDGAVSPSTACHLGCSPRPKLSHPLAEAHLPVRCGLSGVAMFWGGRLFGRGPAFRSWSALVAGRCCVGLRPPISSLRHGADIFGPVPWSSWWLSTAGLVVHNLAAVGRFCRWLPVAWFEGAGGRRGLRQDQDRVAYWAFACRV